MNIATNLPECLSLSGIKVEEGTVRPKYSKEDTRSPFNGDPLLNVVDKDEFQLRVQQVFKLLGDALSKSFGAYGAPTIISNYPYSHVTKDGFTIMKNMTFDVNEGSLIDCVISNMASDICGRLNFKVGDGTTTAIVSTNKIYESYINKKDYFESKMILPRDIIKKYGKIKDEIVKRIEKKSIKFNDDPEKMEEIIKKIVYISSNGDELITDLIGKIYKEIQYPSIVCELAKDGVTKMEIIEGYQTNISLTDKIYINTDDNVALHQNVDILIFDHRVTAQTYEKILKPLNMICMSRGRHLMCIAPFYDEIALSTIIRRDLMAEYNSKKTVNLILTTCANQTAYAKSVLGDLAMLLNTSIIDKGLESDLIKQIDAHNNMFEEVFNISNRKIPGINVYAYDDKGQPNIFPYEEGSEIAFPYETTDETFRVGFASTVSSGLEKTVFKGFYYNEALYNKFVSDAKYALDETVEKYSKLGTYNAEVMHAQNRYSAIKLKMGVIEVGGDSSLSQKMYKDAVDDAVKAAESAYNNGYIYGCNVTLLKVLTELYHDWELSESSPDKDLTLTLISILIDGFNEVYRTILKNAFPEVIIDTSDFTSYNDADEYEKFIENITERMKQSIINIFGKNDIFSDSELNEIIRSWCSSNPDVPTLYDIIILYSIENEKVFDLVSKRFSKDVINSAKTDTEILTAVVDLMNILITGNQLVITGKHNF